ncbi:MAG: deiodinase family protein [Planctomycetales bacterium]|nr:deiodinase family protein [Planctomycetales bacterium]
MPNLEAQEAAPAKPAVPAAAPATTAPTAEAPSADPSKLPLAEIEKAFEGTPQPEAVKMLLAIARGSRMGSGDGWFGPADSRYSWKWLAERQGVTEKDPIPKDKFQGTELWFSRLDRNKDGRVTADDMDWSDNNPWVQQAYMVNRMFRRMESNGDGRLTMEELQAFFTAAAGGKDYVSSENLRDALLGGAGNSFAAGDAPTPSLLIRGLFAGEVGSLNEGPQLNARAPLFVLKTHDGEQTINLGDLIGKKPIVITFGNFTCGPFRSMLPGVEDIHKRFAEEATFLMVYVREAHPTDGWKMESNRRVGVEVAQPKTFEERAAVATQCRALLKPTMPVLVDEINDPVGSAYSGMPARMYVIDLDGRVAYKSGRGPFGFKSGEMEQALVMTLLDRAATQVKTAEPAEAAAAGK